ncbi:glycoside hydrolase family 16 protein [Pluteus cervinus]|uniref:Glycoside hydrolase family 16 protein n=1 Tax=Pluteus cervinus TaxID=181527 RepID=A0ACD3B4B4_9AGAR|nr:glycoside hydrolase family 16 protein [Pluteus cervinus]
MHSTLAVLFPLLASFFVAEVRATGSCNATNLCSSTAPCCSEFGFCGDDSFCLGGCQPFASNTLSSCRPRPLCQDATYVFSDNSRILSNATFFDGNTTEYDWVVNNGNIMNTNSSGGELALLLTEGNGGTRISSTRYVHYGTITTRLKTGRWAGVVTAFITMSDVKDEIDWEFPGAATTQGQSNFFWQGVIPDKTAGDTHNVSSDTFANYHDYTIDWQPDALTFSIDGNAVRTVKASDTVQNGIQKYPTTPAQIQLSIWPAGTSQYPPGTVQWAGGMINWLDPDYTSAGHFYALVQSVTVKCTDPSTPSANITGYAYVGNTTGNPTIAFSNASILLNGASTLQGLSLRFPGAVALTSAMLLALSVL